MKTVAIIDYNCGNIFSICNALKSHDIPFAIVETATELQKYDRAILPGVGAFPNAIKLLDQLGLLDGITKFVASGRLLFGICVGLQVMMDNGLEQGKTNGLGLIGGDVAPLPLVASTGEPLKIPHIAWSGLEPGPTFGQEFGQTSPLRSCAPGSQFYFVHSFAVRPNDPKHILATAQYNGIQFCAAAGRDNIFGTQFHPERSGAVGLRLLREFATLST
ncbi:MAG: imidazole glycerol phosphate synthase subunit HisH [Dinoroseobacter sp.]|nr:imidazole glycerol phosphate synthase subunit HisH [Dinoroseobacter sp.]